ncbi:hypothetical protein Tco_0829810 [Tanacetum coccineum]
MNYEEVKGIYEKVKRYNETFTAISTPEDEDAIRKMNDRAAGRQSTVDKETDSTLPEELSKKRKGTIRKMKSSRIIKKRKIQKSVDELKTFLKIVDIEGKSAQNVEIMEQHSLISRFSVVQSPEGEYIAVQRANGHIRAFNTLSLGLILLGDLTTMMETTEESDDELWANQNEWEIIRWRLYESSGVYTLELENGTMIHMLVDHRYPLTRELMQRMLEHKLEVQKETEDALNVIRFIIKQKEELEKEEE